MNKRAKYLLLILPLLIACSSNEERFNEVSDLKGFYVCMNNEDIPSDLSNYQSNENIYVLMDKDYKKDMDDNNFVMHNGLYELPLIQYSHYYNAAKQDYNILSANYVEIKSTIYTNSIENVERNLYFVYEDDGEYEAEDNVEYSRQTSKNEIIIKLKDIEKKSIRGEQCPYGVYLQINIVEVDQLKKLQIIEYGDYDKLLRTSVLESFQEDFKLTSETKNYYIKSTFVDAKGNEYTNDSNFYEEEINNYEVNFMSDFGYIARAERFMNIHW